MTQFFAIFWTFLKLGFIGFGGPAAHISLFHHVFVTRLKWLDSNTFGKYNALANALPGPGSSQLGYSIGIHKGGKLGGIAAFLGFTLPSFALMLSVALGASYFAFLQWPWVQAIFTLFVCIVVADAVWQMSKKFCLTWVLRGLMLIATLAVLWQPAYMLIVILCAALIGQLPWLHAASHVPAAQSTSQPASRVQFSLYMLLPLCVSIIGLLAVVHGLYVYEFSTLWQIVSIHLETGYHVFGGGHVMLPLLKETLVTPNYIPFDTFMNGYGVAQLIPGPLFTFAAFTGASSVPDHATLAGTLATLAIFLPGLLLMTVCLPIIEAVEHATWFKRALTGINAAVTGILLSTLWTILFSAYGQSFIQTDTIAISLMAAWGLGIAVHLKFKSIWITLGYCIATILCMFSTIT